LEVHAVNQNENILKPLFPVRWVAAHVEHRQNNDA